MTVEQLIERLSQELPQALVFVEVTPCVAGGPVTYEPTDFDTTIIDVRPCDRHGRVVIETVAHDC